MNESKVVEQELALEQEMLNAGVNRYYEQLTVRGTQSAGPGIRLMGVMTETLSTAIEETLEAASGKRSGRRAAILSKLSGINPGTMALLTVRCVIQALGDHRSKAQTAHLIGQLVAEHDDWVKLTSAKPGLAYKVGKQLEKSTSEAHRRKVTRHVVSQYHESGWVEEETAKAGMWLLELLLAHTNLAKDVQYFSKGKRKTRLEATEETEAFLIAGHIRCEGLSPVYTPMVCPPQPWTDPWNGGYLQRRLSFIKVRDQKYLQRLNEADLTEVYDALNALQATAYRVNQGVLMVLQDALDAGHTLPGMVAQEPAPLPAKPHDIDTNEQALKDWKREAAKVHAANATIRGERVAMLMKVHTAADYAKYGQLYFPHTLDWRGRAYPVPVFLNPQGDDIAKALLSFAEGKPLGEEGAIWLKVHTANLFGVDKVSFGERVQWVDDNMEHLLASAADPVASDFWTTADKPWQALAACFELLGYSIEGDDYVSHLPVAMDGSCNGLQHLSAMLLDEVGGAAVNLVPAEKPGDIYTMVADRVTAKLQTLDDPRAEMWLDMGVSRKLVKRPVMTTPYSVSQYGIRDQLKKEIVDQGLVAGREAAWLTKDTDKLEKAAYYAASFIAPLVSEAINEEVLASRDVMSWLKECGKAAAHAGVQLSWVNPAGLPTQQSYFKTDGKKHQASIGTIKVQVWLAQDTDKLNVQKIANGMSPNVIHSYDGAHMMLTVNRCAEAGITSLAMVHDSYATHACDVIEMSYLLRGVFVEIYSEDQLASLYHQFMDQMPAGEELPSPPARRGLNISEVLKSDFFFA